MRAFIPGLLGWYFGILGHYGLQGVVLLMTLESSVFPVPSEMVIPPAAVVGLQPHAPHVAALLLVLLVILAGTFGSFLGSSITYWIARVLGRPLVLKYGKYVLITEHKLLAADRWMVKYGAFGVFLARLLPGVRQLIAIPAGIIGMRYYTFGLMTLLGSFVWCSVLALFGLMMRHEMWAIIAHHGQFASPLEQQVVRQALWRLTGGLLVLEGVALACHWSFTHRRQRGLTQQGSDIHPPATSQDIS